MSNIQHYGLGGSAHEIKAVWYSEISSGTTGQITVPTGGTFSLNEFGNLVDALVVTMSGVGGFPTWTKVQEAGGTVVAATFDQDGNYVLSGTPSAYPVALVFVYIIASADYDVDLDLLEHEIPGISDHGELMGLADDDHSQYHTDARGDARYYTETELDAGQLDNRYFTEAEHLNSSAGVGDANKPIKLDADGQIDATMLNDADIDHGSIGGLTDNDHNQYSLLDGSNQPYTGNIEVSKAVAESKLTSTGDSNDTRIVRTSVSGVAQRFNTVLTQGGQGNALACDGTNDSMNLGNSSDLKPGTGDFSVSIWIRSTDIGDGVNIIGDREQTIGFSVSWSIRERVGKLAVHLQQVGAHRQYSNSGNILDGDWHHFVFTWDMSSNTQVIYVDNVVETTLVNMSGTVTEITNARDVYIGQFTEGTGFLEGDLDEVAIWKGKVLSANDVSDLWGGGVGFFINKDIDWPTDGGSMGSNLSALYHLDERVMNSAPGGTDIEDSSGNGNHGTESGSMTDSDFIPGKINSTGADNEINVWKMEDGVNPLEAFILTIGDNNGRLSLKGGDVADAGITFNLSSIEVGRFDGETKTLIIDNGAATEMQLITRAGVGASSQAIQEWQDSTEQIKASIGTDDIVLGDAQGSIQFLPLDVTTFGTKGIADITNASLDSLSAATTAITANLGSGAGNDFIVKVLAGNNIIVVEGDNEQVNIGNGSTELQILSGGDTIWVGEGSGIPFGGIFVEGVDVAITLAAQDTYYQITAWSSGAAGAACEVNLITAEPANDHLVIVKAGKYMVSWNVAAYSSLKNEYEFEVFINNGNTGFPCTESYRTTGVANAVGSIGGHGLIDLAATDTVELWVERKDGAAVTKTITIRAVTLSVFMVGGT